MYKTASRFLQYLAYKGATFWQPKHKRKKPKPQRNIIPKKTITAYRKKKYVKGKIIGQIKGGYSIHISSSKVFCPFSEMYPKGITKSDLSNLQNKELEFKIIQVYPNVVVSRKQAAKMEALRNARMAFKKRVILSGVVKEIKEYGVFIDIGGTDGLLRINEIKKKGLSSSDLIKGKIIKIVITDLDINTSRISLSLPVDLQTDHPFTKSDLVGI